jgi:hypothetical protein
VGFNESLYDAWWQSVFAAKKTLRAGLNHLKTRGILMHMDVKLHAYLQVRARAHEETPCS